MLDDFPTAFDDNLVALSQFISEKGEVRSSQNDLVNSNGGAIIDFYLRIERRRFILLRQ